MKLLRISNIIWTFVLMTLLFLSIFYSFISADAPYYLSVARDLSNGLILFKDILNSYTPVMMYLNSVVFRIFDDPGYHYFLIFQYVIILMSSGFLYLICRRLDLDKLKSTFLGLFLFIAVLSSDGNYINLEVYILLFVLLSFWFLKNKQFFWTGIFLALSFFSKQYGILNFLPFFLLIWVYHGLEKKHLRNFVIGAILPLSLFIIYFLIIENVTFISLIKQLTGSGYGQKGIASTKSLFSILAGSKVFLLLIFPLFFLRIKPLKNRIDAILILGIIINLIPVAIQSFQHYYILTFPYIFVLIARNYKNLDRNFFVVSNLSLILISTLLFLRIFRYKDVYKEQIKIAKKYEVNFPVGSNVFLYGEIRYLYILNNYHNPVLSEIGYSYLFKPDEDFREKYTVLQLE